MLVAVAVSRTHFISSTETLAAILVPECTGKPISQSRKIGQTAFVWYDAPSP